VHADLAAVRRGHAEQHVRQSSLPGAVLAEQRVITPA